MPFDASNQINSLAQFVSYVCTDQGAALARSVHADNGDEGATIHGGGLSGAARVSPDTLQAHTLLAEIGNIPVEMACDCVAEICSSGANVIVLGDHTDLGTYRSLRSAGALEYFGFPVTAGEILSVVTKTPEPRNVVVQMPVAPVKSPAIAVVGARGGVGASLLVQNLAVYGSAVRGAQLRVGLLDADLQFGTQAIDLDREETAGLFEALMAPERIDDTFINATMDHVNERFSLYSHQIGTGQDAAPYEGGLSRLIEPMRTQFEAVITDMPRTLMFQRSDLAQAFDALVVVIPAGFAGVNAASRLIKRVTSVNPDLKILPVLSEVRRDAGLSLKDIRSTIGQDVIATLQRCDKSMARAQRAARPLIEIQPRSQYSKAVTDIWTAAMAKPKPSETPATLPLLRRIFK